MSTAVIGGENGPLPFAIYDLHPEMRAPVERLIAATSAFEWQHAGGYARFEAFEGYRSPERQHYLFATGKSTKARPWQSAHQYGLAVDFAVRVYKPNSAAWAWLPEFPWHKLKAMAAIAGLRIPIKWDQGHVQHPAFQQFKIIIR